MKAPQKDKATRDFLRRFVEEAGELRDEQIRVLNVVVAQNIRSKHEKVSIVKAYNQKAAMFNDRLHCEGGNRAFGFAFVNPITGELSSLTNIKKGGDE